MGKLNGKYAVVTGGGKGIGRAVVERFVAEEAAGIAILDYDIVTADATAAKELGPKNITVNAICPGYFYTPLTKETLDSDFFQANAKTMIPEERYGNEGELDTAAIFLASPASSYVTGVNLPVDGGYTCM